MEVLKNNVFLIKEHLGILKAANNYDVHDPRTGQIIMECREPSLGFFTKLLRFTDYKSMTPFDVQIRLPDGTPIVRIKRGISIFLSKVEVTDADNRLIGTFKQKLFSIGGKFDLVDANDQLMCQLKGNLIGWNFRFIKDDIELANVSKKWAGIGKEFFTSADNYVLEVADQVGQEFELRKLILAAVMCIDMVLKEK
ncbi:MAG: RNAase [Kangiellaceae bacterium]|nr:RNAase [Kangiellaceae bacterium]